MNREAIVCFPLTGIDQGRSSSLTDVRGSTELSRNDSPSGRGSSTPSTKNKPDPWPSEFVSKLVTMYKMQLLMEQLSNFCMLSN